LTEATLARASVVISRTEPTSKPFSANKAAAASIRATRVPHVLSFSAIEFKRVFKSILRFFKRLFELFVVFASLQDRNLQNCSKQDFLST
jgi:hypothetical protein